MALSSTNIVERASLLAATLANGPVAVEKNVLRGLVADFMVEPDVARLRRLLELLAEGSGGHLLRGGGYGEQVQAAATELGALLAETDLDPRDLQRLFGWTARLLVARTGGAGARGEKAKPRAEPATSQRSRPPAGPGLRRNDHRKKDDAVRVPKPDEPAKLGGVGAKGQGALEELKRRLLEREGEKK